MGPDLKSVSRETLERLHVFAAMVREWSTRINLVGARDLPVLWERHVLDSLQLAAFIPIGVRCLTDLGSGGGFPGIPLAVATGLHVNLVEADRRKAAFLREAARATRASVTVHCSRIETVELAATPVITARAFAPLPRLLPLASRLLTADGCCLLPKGAQADLELTAASQQWHMQVERFPSATSPSGVILRISRLSRV